MTSATLFFQVLCVLENVVGANDTIVENSRQQCVHAQGHLVNHFTLLATTITWSICAMVYTTAASSRPLDYYS